MEEARALRVSGPGPVPPPWATFAACRFQRSLVAAFEGLGFAAPTPIQAHCWPLIAGGRDVVGVAETGSGKTLAFLAPAFDLHLRRPQGTVPPARPTMLALAPTRELALQIEREAVRLGKAIGIRSCCVYGGVDYKPQVDALRKRPSLVVACPGRLLDLADRKKVVLGDVGYLVLDEADRMLDLGFSEAVAAILERLAPVRQTVLFTATWPQQVQELASSLTSSPVRIQQGETGELSCNARVQQELRLCNGLSDKLLALVGFLRGLALGSRAIVFVNTKAAISGICQDLVRAGLACVSLHADLDQQDREHSLEELRSGRCPLAVATDVAARGLDVRDVQAVVCFDPAQSRETHVHRIGRTGRAGASGRALTLICRQSQAELSMAQQIFEFMRQAGQVVPAVLKEEVCELRASGGGVRTGGQGETIVALEDSDDDDGQEDHEELEEEVQSDGCGGARDCEYQFQSLTAWVPWYRRPLVARDAVEAPAQPPHRSSPAGGSPGAYAWEGSASSSASDMGSFLSGTTYLNNPVEQLFGHAAARDISVRMCRETVRSGCRLLTCDTNGFQVRDGAKGARHPFRWMALRRVPWTEIAEHASQRLADEGEPGQEFVWHVVVHELLRTKAGRVRIATNFFKSNLSMVYDYIIDAFQLLDEDDPQLIQAAVATESLVTLLRLYFNTGDTQNPKFFHTMAKLSLWPAGTLLHHCCENGFSRCVEYLLRCHSPHTAPRDAPWLQLADPLWQDKSWRNSAFHSAAWTGQPGPMALLVQWANDHAQLSKIRNLFDKRKQTAMDLLEVRLKQKQGQRVDVASFKATFNILAPVFGKRPFGDVSREFGSGGPSVGDGSVVVEDADGNRRSLGVPPGTCTSQILANIAERVGQTSLSGATLMFSRVQVEGLQSTVQETAAVEQLLATARLCRRVSFVNCSVPWQTAVALCGGVARFLRQSLRGLDLAWESFAMPSWTEVPSRGSWEFAEVLLDLCAAIRETSAVQAMQQVQLAAGTTTGYLPSSQRHLPQVLMATLSMKSVARHLLGNSPEDWRDTELWKRTGGSKEAFLCYNPLLKGPDTLERKLLDRGALSVSGDVCSCLSPGWPLFVEALADCLVSTLLAMPQWAPRVAGREVQEGEQGLRLIQEWADEALLHVLRMRRSRSRSGGLPRLGSLVGPYLLTAGEAVDTHFPKSMAYFHSKFPASARRCQGTRPSDRPY